MSTKIPLRELTLIQLYRVFRNSLIERHWIPERVTIDNLYYVKDKYRIVDLWQQMYCLSNYDVHQAMLSYLELLEKGLEEEAEEFLRRWRIDLSLKETYDLFVKLAQVPVSRILNEKAKTV